MYRPKKYIKDEKQFVFSFIQQNPFATFIVQGKPLMATHIPVLISGTEEHWNLYSHIANHNKQLEFLKDGAEALVIFQGPQAYISSSWYKEKDISTWDYSAVHVNAKLKIQSREELEESLKNLVYRFEKKQENPLFYKDIPNKMLEEHLPLITGFWLEPLKVEGIAKLHQSYEEHDIKAVSEKLKNSENPVDRKLADDMLKENNL